MNTLISRKATLFIALVMSIVLFTAAIPAQAGTRVSGSFTVKHVITISFNIDTGQEVGNVEVSIFGITLADVEVSRNDATVDLVDINWGSVRLNLSTRVRWNAKIIRFSGEACAAGDCSDFSRSFSWDNGY